MQAAEAPAETDGGEDPSGGTEFEELKREFDSLGVGVRAGIITPTVTDEDHFRKKAGLPPLSKEARKAWGEEKNVRRPITLTPPPGAAPKAAFGAPKENQGEDDEPDDDDTK
jgi:hypothetical protein